MRQDQGLLIVDTAEEVVNDRSLAGGLRYVVGGLIFDVVLEFMRDVLLRECLLQKQVGRDRQIQMTRNQRELLVSLVRQVAVAVMLLQVTVDSGFRLRVARIQIVDVLLDRELLLFSNS